MGNYDNYKTIKYSSLFLKYYLVFALFTFILLTLLGYTSDYIGLIFIPVVLIYFYLSKIDACNIGSVDDMVRNNEPLFTQKPSPGTTLMDMLKKQEITCEDIKSIQFMACSLQHWFEYYQKKMINQDYRLDKIERIEVYAVDDKSRTLESPPSNVHFFPTNSVLTRHTNLIKLKDNRLFMCYEPEHIILNGEDELNYGSFLVEIKSKNVEKVERSFLNEMNYMRKVA